MSSSLITRSGTQKAKVQTRSMKASETARKPNLALLEAKKKAKLKMLESTEQIIPVKDIFQNAMDAKRFIRGETGVIFDESMAEHKCLWEKNHPERPERFLRIIERCNELQLIERCKRLSARKATKEEILYKHSDEHYNLLESICKKTDENELEDISSRYDSIYFHPSTFDLSLLATGSTIDLVDNILHGNVQNGMAIIRPPGHHAMKAEFNGYCFFNNVSIAAQYALDKYNIKKILIVDWDVHHGQATQRFFYNDPRVLYFSIHRFEHGVFWPNLRESDFDYIGEDSGKGFNFNLPLNEPGMKNTDYLAIFQQILIPVAVEFQPELIIVSAGYDAALGCPEGEMELTPAVYSHLINPLLCLAQSRVAVILEGGYCLDSLAEGAALTLRTLLGDPCPILIDSIEAPCESVQSSILNCIYSHRGYWKCLQTQETYTLMELNNLNPQQSLHKVIENFKGGDPLPEKFPTRDCYPVHILEIAETIANRLNNLKLSTNLTFPKIRVCYVYDEFMLQHKNNFEDGHPEQPERIKQIYNRHKEYNLINRMVKLKSRHAITDEICLVHTRAHVNSIRRNVDKPELRDISESFNSVYFHKKTFECATLAAGSVLEVVDSVLNGDSRSGICIIRPPGHHAESDLPHGFCIFNNIAIAAQYAVRNHGLKRALIIDWDVHHGNGTQHIFESNPNILYISVHRYDNGSFFPNSKDADFKVVGDGAGEGFNVNIPWNKKAMGDLEYSMVFQQIIMPIAYEYNPELVLVSAGFDAAIGDPLGGCKVTPEAYGYFTHWLSGLANGKIIICLEGGYNVNSISYAMTMCTKSLLGDPLPILSISSNKTVAYQSCIETIQNVLSIHEKYWKTLKFHKKLPQMGCNQNVTKCEMITEMIGDMKISQCADNNDSGEKYKSNKSNTNESDDRNNVQPGPSVPQENKKTLVDYLCENQQALQNEEMFAVVPLKTCPHLAELRPDEAPSIIDTQSPCSICQSTQENWICLHCFKVYCGRYVNEHALFHHLESGHSLALSFSDLSVWCYPCEAYIDNQRLYKYKNLAHCNKFDGEELVWSYGTDTIHLTDN